MQPTDDFSGLRNLLALKRLEVPMDTEVNRFLIEFHRRQRSQLLIPSTRWSRATSWLKERASALGMVPSLSYACAVGAIALTVFVGLSQDVKVTQVDGQYQFSLLSPGRDPALAMMPASFGSLGLSQKRMSAPATFSAVGAQSTTRFVLANSHPGYDASVTF